MKAVFIESVGFTEWVAGSLPDESYARLQQELMRDPEKGAAIVGCGGLRKVRVADPRRGKGKRGGARVIYLYVPQARWFFMLDGYGKDENDDLSAAEKKALGKLVDALKQQAEDAARRRERKEHR
jgi:hypothetical protein